MIEGGVNALIEVEGPNTQSVSSAALSLHSEKLVTDET